MIDDLARRAVACSRWRWMPGMRWTVRTTDDERLMGWGRAPEFLKGRTPAWRSRLPDLTDPATRGCLLALVREAYGDQTASPQYRSGSWVLSAVGPAVPLVTARTEARCLVLALEHAP